MVLIDASIWIEANRRNGDLLCKLALKSLLQLSEATLCSPVKLEVLGGARAEERPRLDARFAIIPYIAVLERHWDAAVRLNWQLRDEGHTIPNSDILIACVALAKNCRVYARDKHFDTMAEALNLRLYEPGLGGSFRPDTESSR